MLFTNACRNSANVGGWNDCVEVTTSLFVDVYSSVYASIASSGMSSSNGHVFSQIVASSDNALAD